MLIAIIAALVTFVDHLDLLLIFLLTWFPTQLSYIARTSVK